MSYYYTDEELQSLHTNCNCLPIEVPFCAEIIYFPTIYLEQELLFYFVDKFGKEYLYLTVTDNQGWAGVETSWFPNGVFNPYAGKFRVFFTSSISPKGERLYFRSDSGLYPCLYMQVIDTIYTNLQKADSFFTDLKKYYCCCERQCPAPEPECDNPETIDFTL